MNFRILRGMEERYEWVGRTGRNFQAHENVTDLKNSDYKSLTPAKIQKIKKFL